MDVLGVQDYCVIYHARVLTSEERETKKERQKERDKKRETKKERQKLLLIHYESIQQCLHIFLSSTVTSFTIEENTTKFLIN